MRDFFKLIGFAFFLLLFSCNTVDPEGKIDLKNVKVIGHGGIGFQSLRNNLPHNSFTSVVKAIEGYNADGVEIDVQLSADSVLFMYHDEKLHTMTDGDGCIYTRDSEYLAKCNYNNNININVFADEKLTPLSRALDVFSKRKVKPIVSLDVRIMVACLGKGYTDDVIQHATAKELARLINLYNGHDWIIVESGDVGFLNILRSIDSNVKCVINGYINSDLISLAKNNGFYGVGSPNDNSSAQTVQLAHDAGLKVSLFYIKTRGGIVDAVNKNPDYIQTDNIPLLQDALRRR